MQVIIKSEVLYDNLKKRTGGPIQYRAMDDFLILDFGNNTLKIPCRFEGACAWFPCGSIDWALVTKTCKHLDNQDIILDIAPFKMQLTLNF